MDKKIILLILLVAVASSLGTAFSLGGTNIIFRTSPDGISSNEIMRITSDGKVGIGTAAPTEKLDVGGNVTLSGTINCVGCVTSASLAPGVGTDDWNNLKNIPANIANGDQDALRTYNKNPPYGAPCDSLNSDTTTTSYVIKDNAAITQLGFDPIIGNLPIFADAAVDPYLGEIILFGGNFAPTGWAFAQGQLLPLAQNQALFALLGTQYGGDGITTFALPDLRCLEPEGNGPVYIIALQGIFPSHP